MFQGDKPPDPGLQMQCFYREDVVRFLLGHNEFLLAGFRIEISQCIPRGNLL